ncbi:MAG TPA: hypothetical protein VK196_22385 [Magnetospirillum sp.]|nr:hypothetical protein [Magnetospirillum sp.]
MKTLLQIVQDICKETGQPRPSVVASATTETPLRMMRMVNRAGRQLAIEHDWQALTTVTTFTPTATQVQASHPPAGFLRFTSQTQLWDIGNKRPAVGPLSPQKWLRLVVDSQQSIDKYWTMIGGQINILPVPATTDSFVYAYQTKYWAQNAALAGVEAFSADDDTPLISDELLILEGIWRWKQALGLDYAEDMATAARYKEMAIAADRGPRILTLDRPFRSGAPDTFWPGTITP